MKSANAITFELVNTLNGATVRVPLEPDDIATSKDILSSGAILITKDSKSLKDFSSMDELDLVTSDGITVFRGAVTWKGDNSGWTILQLTRTPISLIKSSP
jgi:hypothetical protein